MNQIIDVKPIDTKEIITITKESETLVSNLEKWHIINQTDYNQANIYLKLVKSKLKELDEKEKVITSPLNVARKAVIDLFRKPKELLSNIESKIKSEMIDFSEKEEQKRREEEEKLREELSKKAERAEKSGKLEKAEELRTQAEVVTISPTIEKPKGISFREVWRYRILDETVLDRQYLVPNHEMLSKMAQATKGQVEVKGVQFYSEKIVASR